jgi:signal transduction histidine kinase/CheY-like chemotaxis protein
LYNSYNTVNFIDLNFNDENNVLIDSFGILKKPKPINKNFPLKDLSLGGWSLKFGDLFIAEDKIGQFNLLPIALRIEKPNLDLVGILTAKIPLENIQQQIDFAIKDSKICYLVLDNNLEIVAKSNDIKDLINYKTLLSNNILLKSTIKNRGIIYNANVYNLKIDNCYFKLLQKSKEYKFIVLSGYNEKISFIELSVNILKNSFQSLIASLLCILLIYLFYRDKIIPFFEELVISKELADSASSAKSKFLSNMTHEIRTPINGIIGITNILKESTNLKKEDFNNINTINHSAQSLMLIVNEILDFSKIGAEKIIINNKPLLLRNLIDEIGNIMVGNIVDKKIEIITHVNNDIPNYILADVYRLRQILINLVNNAIKFTKWGYVILEISSYQKKEVTHLKFSVRDTGIGIPSDKINNLFQPFTQLDMSSSKKYTGTGLGLSICKELIELMNGEISVTKNQDCGSEFFFHIPLIKDDKLESSFEKISVEKIIDKKILIIDISDISFKYLQKKLQALPVLFERLDNIKIKNNQQLFLDINDYNPDLIIINYDRDNFYRIKNFITAFKNNNEFYKISVVLLIYQEDYIKEKELLQNTFTKIIFKPLKNEELILSIILSFDPNYLKKDADYSLKNGNEKIQKEVLVCEDNEVNLKITLSILKKFNIIADFAKNGKEAINKFTLKQYTLIFMDCMMPVLDGYEATKKIREIEKIKNENKNYQPVFIVATTANYGTEEKNKCLQVGMNEMLSKPFGLEEIQKIIENI